MTTSKALTRQTSVLGSGLGLGSYVGILAVSVLLFVSWDGWMWRAGPNASHVARFALSYLSVLPLAALALWLAKTFSLPRFATAVGTLWAIKLVITAPLYLAFGPRGGLFGMSPAATRKTSTTAARSSASSLGKRPPNADNTDTPYEAADGPFAEGAVIGTVRSAGLPWPGAAVYLVHPRAGRELAEQTATPIVIAADEFEAPLYLGFVGSELRAENRDKALHRLALVRLTGNNERNLPLPPNGHAAFAPSKIGEFVLQSQGQTGANLTATLLVLDHPYATITDKSGAFALKGVTAGPIRIAALARDGNRMLRAQIDVNVASAGRAEVQLDLKAQP